MADFCKQCSVEVFGEDYEDLARLIPANSLLHTICEGCEDAIVDSSGECMAADCLKRHGTIKGDSND